MSAHIIDVRLDNKTSNGEINVRDEIIKGLSYPAGQKILPQLLLYDEEGLRIYDEITTQADEYYVSSAEEAILKEHANDIVHVMQGLHENKDNHPIEGVVLELGAGYVHRFQALPVFPCFPFMYFPLRRGFLGSFRWIPMENRASDDDLYSVFHFHPFCYTDP